MADELNFQIPPQGFDSYLYGIIPDDQAVLAGAFSVSMQQIRNVEKVDIKQFAKTAFNMESTIGLPLTNGTDIPTSIPMTAAAQTKTGLGSGAYGTYTMSNFFGAMSGLPYPWQNLLESIQGLETVKLRNIYQELFLAVTWQPYKLKVTQLPLESTGNFYSIVQAYVAPTASPNPANPNYQPDPDKGPPDYPPYDPVPYLNAITGLPTYSPTYYSDPGKPEIYDWWYRIELGEDTQQMNKPWLINGGYHRGTAPLPIVQVAIRMEDGSLDPRNVINPNTGALSSPTGGYIKLNMGTDPYGAKSYGEGSYGRLSINVPGSNLKSAPWRWLQNDYQQGWRNKYGEDTLDNPPTPPNYSNGKYGQYTQLQTIGTGPTQQGRLPPLWSPTGGDGKGGPVGGNRPAMPAESVTVEYPPIADLPVTDAGKATNGVNTPGRTTAGLWQTLTNPLLPPSDSNPYIQVIWPAPAPQGTIFWFQPGNNVTQKYIDQSNLEIKLIQTRTSSNFEKSNALNTLWNITGVALKHEQRARYNALTPVPVPWDRRYSTIPTSVETFVDSIPEYAKQTQPHMAVQTLEHISNTDTIGGQSIIAMMRQERNQQRLADNGIELDNNMPSKMNMETEQRLMLNGTVPGAIEGVPSPTGEIYTIPAWADNSKPVAYWDCSINGYRLITGLTKGNVVPILNGDGCPVVNSEVPVGQGLLPYNPNEWPYYMWDPTFPPPVRDPNLDNNVTSPVIKPPIFSVDDAIDHVIECNCDCWVK